MGFECFMRVLYGIFMSRFAFMVCLGINFGNSIRVCVIICFSDLLLTNLYEKRPESDRTNLI